VPITDDLCRSFLDLWWHFDPAAATRSGLPDHDRRLGSFDAEAVRAHHAALRSIAGAVEELDVESVTDEIDRTALLDQLRVLLFRFEHEQPWKRNPALWIEHAADALDGLLPLCRRDPGAAEALRARIEALPDFLGSSVTTIRQPPALLLGAARAGLDGLAALLGQVPSPTAEDVEALRRAHDAITLTREALHVAISPDPSPHAAAIGEDEVDRLLHHEHASVHNAGEVWRAALREATELEAEVTAFAAAIDPARPWREVYEERRDRMPAPGEWVGALEFALRASQEFAGHRGLALPDGALLAGSVTPGYVEVLDPVAAYRPGNSRSPAAVLAGRLDPLALPWIAVQLGSPGLHLHFVSRARSPGLVRRHIAASSAPLGWALYVVEWMAAEGYAPAPELQLSARVHLLRAAHLALADLGLHTRQFTADEALGHLTTRLPIEPAVATAEVRRIACRPLEACAAMLGRRELKRLRADCRVARGAEFNLPEFHQEVLSYGGLPVPLMRWGMGLDG
jgi:hypothetical protein